MKRSELKRLRELYKRHVGEKYRISKALGVRPHAVYQWFTGKTVSARIEAAILARAAELEAQEREQSAGKGAQS